ncbi:MAG: BrnT family toxin [Actinobacteria bacterium]|nr:MAG: BrnT family toxin [Actinomycetota bacterium]
MVSFRFEYDEAKSRTNKLKHGIDFEEAQGLWSDRRLAASTARSETEPRILVTGMLGGKLWTAVVTWRSDRIRIISVRRARPREAQAYARQDHQR